MDGLRKSRMRVGRGTGGRDEIVWRTRIQGDGGKRRRRTRRKKKTMDE